MVVLTRSTALTCSQMVTLFTRSGHHLQNLFPYLVSSTIGTERSSELSEMILDVSTLQFQLSMANQGSHTIPSTRSILKDQMEREETEIQHGLVWQSKIQPRSFMTASGGILKKNSFGLIRGLFHNLHRVFVSTKHM